MAILKVNKKIFLGKISVKYHICTSYDVVELLTDNMSDGDVSYGSLEQPFFFRTDHSVIIFFLCIHTF